jgi:hypothetical protein
MTCQTVVFHFYIKLASSENMVTVLLYVCSGSNLDILLFETTFWMYVINASSFFWNNGREPAVRHSEPRLHRRPLQLPCPQSKVTNVKDDCLLKAQGKKKHSAQ